MDFIKLLTVSLMLASLVAGICTFVLACKSAFQFFRSFERSELENLMNQKSYTKLFPPLVLTSDRLTQVQQVFRNRVVMRGAVLAGSILIFVSCKWCLDSM